MHVKQVVVSGFRSYKDQVVVGPFSEAHNVVVGRNGTGKSNFFDAIRFCLLTSRFANLRPEERQALLHEGAGKHVLSAYVEIVFDNSDGRLPVDDAEVVLRRTIGVKKDEFFVNRKHITKTDVVRLLESAGFSRSNPYYIVQQGKVNALALMKEKERLELLKEVAGTKVYEDRRVESLKILHETQNRREKIQEVVSYIEERLAELEEEKEELREYQQLDREQRALEYTMHDKELQNARAEVEAIDRRRNEVAALTTDLHEKQLAVQKKIVEIETTRQTRDQDLARLSDERRAAESERKELMEARYKLEIEVKELREKRDAEGAQRSILMKELEVVQQEIKAKQTRLETAIVPAFQQTEQAHARVSRQLQEATAQSDHLIAKQSRKSQFRTQQERDDYLTKEIAELERLVQRKQADASSLRESIEALTRSIDESEQQLRQNSNELRDHRRVVDSLGGQILELKERRNTLSEERKEKWRIENQMAYEVRKLTEQLHRGESVLYSTMAYDVRRGLEAVREMGERIRGIHGPLIDLIDPADERYCTAIDEAAGGALFHVVVDTDDVAAKIMRELEQKNLGRITFLPLNRLKVKEVSYPNNDDVVPLIEKLTYPAEIRKAVVSAFGKKLLCRDLDTCVQYAEKANMDCLTLDGDMVHRRGGLNGGYKDPQRSRTRAMMEVKRARQELDNIRSDAHTVKNEAQQADQRVASVIGEIQKEEAKKHHAVSAFERLLDEISRAKERINTETSSRSQKEKSLALQDDEVQDLEARVKSLRSELAAPMQDSLSAEELSRLHQLSATISSLQNEERAKKRDLEDLRAQKDSIELVLSQNLVRRQQELTKLIAEEGMENLALREQEDNLKAKELDLQDASRIVAENSLSLKSIEAAINKIQEDISNEKNMVESLNSEESSLGDQVQLEARRAEKIMDKRRRQLQKREDALKDIRELGTLPVSELDKFKDLSLGDVVKQFNKRTEKLKKYSHVNKKALDQYVSFNEQRATLLERKKELDQGHNSIKDLIDVLDQRKDEAILRTFKGVSAHFAEVFRELVPTGEGKIQLVGADASNLNDSVDSHTQSTAMDTYSGVQIKVNFRGEGDSYLMQQLSGGQKALVALAFIFAIQRSDPAPFYLFDEIDQALDSTHRAAVAALIQRQAHSNENPAQVRLLCNILTQLLMHR